MKIQQLLKVLLTIILLSACKEEKQITRFVKKHGAKEIATHIAINYPEYLKTDTVIYRDSFPYKVIVEVPKIEYDTTYINLNNDCENFDYNDKNLYLHILKVHGKQKVNYEIKLRVITKTIEIVREVKVPGPPCPTETIVQNAKSKFDKELIGISEQLKIYKKTSLILGISWLLFILYTAYRFYKKYVIHA